MKTNDLDLLKKQEKQNKSDDNNMGLLENYLASWNKRSKFGVRCKYIINVFRYGVRKSGTPTSTIKPVGRIRTNLPRVFCARLTAKASELGAIRRRAP